METTLSFDAVEAFVDAQAQKYASKAYGKRLKFQVLLSPSSDFNYSIMKGPTAVVRIGRWVTEPCFNAVLRAAIDNVAKYKLCSCTEIEQVAVINKRNAELKSVLKKRFNFDSDLVPTLLPDNQLTVKVKTRVEVTNNKTGETEVVEFQRGSVLAATTVAKERLSRRHINPSTLPSEHPDWIAQTN